MKKKLVVIALLLATASMAFAQQNLRSGYFLDGYTYKYKMNPAMTPERSFVAIPVISRLTLGVESNIGLSDFIYPASNGKLTTFMNSSVNGDDFLSRLNEVSMLNANINENILAFGFRTGKAFHTVDVSLRADVGARLPKSLFSFLKNGASGNASSWDLSGVGARATSFVEIGYGYSRPINDWINVGARVKLLGGVARADIMVDSFDLTASGTKWTALASGYAEVSGPIKVGTESGTNDVDYENIKFSDKFTPSFGLAVDLGATFEILDFLTASVAVNDLGFILWKGTTTARMPGGAWTFDGLGIIDTDPDQGEELGEQFSQIGEEMLEMVQLEKVEENVNKSSGLSATIHVGVEAVMPFYKRLTFGLLGTQKIDGPYSWTEGRLSANLAPLNWLSLAVTGAVSNFGSSFGGALNLHVKGFTLYAGLDSFLPLMNVTPQYVPVGKFNTNMSLGLHFTFGKAVGRYHKK